MKMFGANVSEVQYQWNNIVRIIFILRAVLYLSEHREVTQVFVVYRNGERERKNERKKRRGKEVLWKRDRKHYYGPEGNMQCSRSCYMPSRGLYIHDIMPIQFTSKHIHRLYYTYICGDIAIGLLLSNVIFSHGLESRNGSLVQLNFANASDIVIYICTGCPNLDCVYLPIGLTIQ